MYSNAAPKVGNLAHYYFYHQGLRSKLMTKIKEWVNHISENDDENDL